MRLVSVTLHGYRRFAAQNRMNVDLPVVAVVGPNEAGKSSLLRALTRLDDEEPFEAGGEGSELTRRMEIPPDCQVVGAHFLLEDSDWEAVKDSHGARAARWMQAWKLPDGRQEARLEPAPRRDRSPRRRAAKALHRTVASRHFSDARLEIEGEVVDLVTEAEEILTSLESDNATLSAEEIDAISGFSEHVRVFVEAHHPQYLRDLPDQMSELANHESEEHPHLAALRVLRSRRPRFLLFSESDRTLSSTYDLEQVADDPPSALGNLTTLAALNLVELRDSARVGDWGRVEALERRANEELERRLHESWRQAAITVRLRVDGTVLRLLVETVPGNYDSIADRSDGLRWFIALLAYTETQATEVPPILLVDEAESHLHYDAQADLVRVFARQVAAAKVIFTTHSAGCLPEDLGAAIRVIAPIPDTERSEIRNWFWEESPGFSPLFLGMGASALAFTTMRRAVIAEGASDLILLPSVLREATGRSELGFQVAPGLAEVSPRAVAELGLIAARVAYIVDGDQGGRAVRRKLEGQGIPSDRIVEIHDGAEGLSLEDLLDRDTLLSAINEELRRSHGEETRMDRIALPDAGRAAAVEQWCRDRRIDAPSKRALANRVLERDVTAPLVAKRRRQAARSLYKELARILGVDLRNSY